VSDTYERRRWDFWFWLRVAVLIYFIPLGVVALDVALFQSRLQRLAGPEVESVLDNVYWPVTVLLMYLSRWLG
jgi:hypothetical protein